MMLRKRKPQENNSNSHDQTTDSSTDEEFSQNALTFLNHPLDQWTCEHIAQYFTKEGCSEIACKFKDNNISQNQLLELTDEHLKVIGIGCVGDRMKTMKMIKEIVACAQPEYRKIFNDPIHGHIEMHPLCVKIIDTPEFQRLRFIKQLGGCYFVYPGASHNRFEHSLGVCHLAGELSRAIRDIQPHLHISEKDILCLEIAGLCHDLGHGPFSHMFDRKFIPKALPQGSDWEHEQASVDMFEHLVKKNKLEGEFTRYGLTDVDLIFIKEQIKGPSEDVIKRRLSGIVSDWPYAGRPKNKSFLYEVVANKRNGIDVDKWDYFARDCYHLGIKNNFDHLRFIKFARVLEVDNELQICTRDKEVQTLYDMFSTRVTLHKRAYQHRVNIIIEHMMTEAFLKADKYLKFPGTDGKLFTMSESIHDMEAYSKLTDNVFHQILLSTEPALKESRQILNKILQRKLYKCIGQTKPNKFCKKSDAELFKDEIVDLCPTEMIEGMKETLIVEIMSMDYGMKSKNPVDHVRFYDKRNPGKAMVVRKEDVSEMLPDTFTDQYICLYVKKDDQKTWEVATKTLKTWCESKHYSMPRGGSFSSVEMTPYKRNNPNMASGSPADKRQKMEETKKALFDK